MSEAVAARRGSGGHHEHQPGHEERKRRDAREQRARHHQAREHGRPARGALAQAQEHGCGQDDEKCERVVAPSVHAEADELPLDRDGRGGGEPDAGREGGDTQKVRRGDEQDREQRRSEVDGDGPIAGQGQPHLRREHEQRLAHAGAVERPHLARELQVAERIAVVGTFRRHPLHPARMQGARDRHRASHPVRRVVFGGERLQAQQRAVGRHQDHSGLYHAAGDARACLGGEAAPPVDGERRGEPEADERDPAACAAEAMEEPARR